MTKLFIIFFITLIFVYCMFNIGMLNSVIITLVLMLLFFLTNLYQSTTGLTKVCLKIYYKARLSGLNHEESLNNIVSSRFKKQAERTNVIDFYQNIKFNNQDKKYDLCDLCYSILIIESGASPMNGHLHKYFQKKFDYVFNKESEKILRKLK